MNNGFLNYEGLVHLWSKLKAMFAGKVDKVDGKGLSTNDYTNDEKTKLAGIEAGANKTIVNNTLTSTSTTEALSAAQGKALSDKIAAINTNMEDLGAGDMLKSVYDTNNDGVVDNAEKLGGQLPAYYATAEALTTEVNRAKAAEEANAKAASDAKAAADAAQADVTALEPRVKANEDAIGVLNGTGEGSVDKTVNDAINEFAAKVSEDGTVNTYKELIDYAASHGAEFTELVGEVDANTKAIATLNGNSSTAGSVDKKIADAFAANLVAITTSEIDTILAN